MGLFDRFKVIKGGNDGIGAHVKEVKESIQKLKKSSSAANIQLFADALRKTIENDEWVAMLGKSEGSKGYLLDYRIQRGRSYISLFTDSQEIKNKPKSDYSLIISGVNKITEPLFQSNGPAGIIINPDTDGFCIDKSFLVKIMLHSQYECQKNPGCPPKDWGLLIPKYKKKNLMTEEDFLNFGMHTIIENWIEKEGYTVVSANDNLKVCPNLILEKNGRISFVVVKGYCAEKEPQIDDFTKNRVLALGKKYNAACFYAPVGFRSAGDLLRFEQCLALKGDQFYSKFDGFKIIK